MSRSYKSYNILHTITPHAIPETNTPYYIPDHTIYQTIPHTRPYHTPDHTTHQTIPHTRPYHTPYHTTHQTIPHTIQCNNKEYCFIFLTYTLASTVSFTIYCLVTQFSIPILLAPHQLNDHILNYHITFKIHTK